MIDAVFLLPVVLISLIVGLFVGWMQEEDVWMKKAIELGLAHYDPKTARFAWNSDREKP